MLHDGMQQFADGHMGLYGGAGEEQQQLQPHQGHHLALLFDDWIHDHLDPIQ